MLLYEGAWQATKLIKSYSWRHPVIGWIAGLTCKKRDFWRFGLIFKRTCMLALQSARFQSPSTILKQPVCILAVYIPCPIQSSQDRPTLKELLCLSLVILHSKWKSLLDPQLFFFINFLKTFYKFTYCTANSLLCYMWTSYSFHSIKSIRCQPPGSSLS